MREKFVIKNIFAKLLSTGLVTLLSFISKKVYVNSLGDEIMGLNALLLSVISMLSLIELGIGNAIYFSLYKPLAEKDEKQITAIMRLYAKIYMIIGLLVLVIGIVVIPFLHFFSTKLPDRILYGAYIIMLLDTALSYYMAYRRNIFNADQKEFFNTNVDTFVNVAISCVQMAAVVVTKNYFLFLGIKLMGTVIGNLYIYIQSGRRYPYLKKKTSYQLSEEFKHTFKENVKALCIINISTYLVFGTDNLLLSTFTTLTAVFIYSNYTAILTAVNQVFHQTFNSMQASVGNFMVIEGKDKSYELFKKIFFINFLVTSYTSTALITLFNSAITIWMGDKYVWPMAVVAILVFNNYSRYIIQAASIFKNAAGLYSPTPIYKYLALLEGIINLIASLFFICVCKLQIMGVFIGTSVSTIVSTIGIPYAIYRYYFKCEAKQYIQRYIQYLALTFIYCTVSVILYQCVRTPYEVCNLFLGLVISFVVPFGLSTLLFNKTEEYVFVLDIVKRYIGKIKNRKNMEEV